jgi:hypothetical protein
MLNREKKDREDFEKQIKLRNEDDELGHQTQIRIVPPYNNPLN